MEDDFELDDEDVPIIYAEDIYATALATIARGELCTFLVVDGKLYGASAEVISTDTAEQLLSDDDRERVGALIAVADIHLTMIREAQG
jgi:hypothetical protein